MTSFRSLCLAAALALAASQTAFAQLSPRNPAEGTILNGWRAADGTRIAALHLRMLPGWHTYWRIPGEAGIAPDLDWSRSQNVRSVRVIWPMPEVFESNGMRSYGYEDEVVLPLEVTPRNPDRPMALMGELMIGVCRDTCVPFDLSVSAVLRGAGEPDPRISGAIEAASDAGPRAGLERVTCRLDPTERGARLTLRATLPRQGRSEHMIVEIPNSPLWITNGRTWREGNDLVSEAQLRDPARGPISLNRSQLAVTVLGGERMVIAQGCVSGG